MTCNFMNGSLLNTKKMCEFCRLLKHGKLILSCVIPRTINVVAGLLLIIAFAVPCFSAGPYGFDDPRLNDEFEKNYHEHKFPNWAEARGNIRGTTTNDNAPAGNVGEYVESEVFELVAFGATDVVTNATSISLTAGDWDVYATLKFDRNGGTPVDTGISISQTSATTDAQHRWEYAGTTALTTTNVWPAFIYRRLSISSTTTVYLTAVCTYTVATPNHYEVLLSARRVR